LLTSELTITHIITVSSKKRLNDHGILVQLLAGARASFQKFSATFL